MKNAFAQGKNAWKSTLTKSTQNKSKNVKSSNMPQRKPNKSMSGEELLDKIASKYVRKS